MIALVFSYEVAEPSEFESVYGPEGAWAQFFGTGAGEKLATRYNTQYLGTIPMDAEVRKGGDSGRPIVVAYPDSEAARALRKIARDVAARVSVLTLQVQADNFIPIQMIG